MILRLPKLNSTTDVLAALTAVALLLSWLSYVFEWSSGASVLDTSSPWFIRYTYVSNPANWIFYLRFLALMIFVGVGFFQWVQYPSKKGNHIAALVAIFCCLIWLIHSLPYFVEALPRLIYANSPLNLLIVFGFFIGLNPNLWKWLVPVLYLIAYGSIVAGWHYAFSLPAYHRHIGGNPMIYHITLAAWPAAFLLLNCERRAILKQVAATLPLVGCIALAVFNQNRSWPLVCLFLLFLRYVLMNPTHSYQKWIQIGLFSLVLVYVCAKVLFLMDTGTSTGNKAVDGLIGRLDEDTRGGQYQAFFEQIPILQLVTGGGPNAGYDFSGRSDYQYIDNQHLFILMKFGLLAWGAYAYTVFAPAFRVLFGRSDYPARGIAYLLLLWGLSLAGLSVFQNIRPGPENMLIVMIAGRLCWETERLKSL